MITPVNSSAQSAAAMATFADSPRALANLPAGQQVKAAAGQFEAILLRQFLQDSVGKIMGGQESGASGGVYSYLLTDVLAAKLSEGGGLGLASVVERQLLPRPAAQPADSTPNPSDS